MGVTRVGSVISCLRPYISNTFVRGEVLYVVDPDKKSQLRSPSKNNSLFSASILSITFSNSLNSSDGEFGGLLIPGADQKCFTSWLSDFNS